MLTVEQIIQNYSNNDDIVIRIGYRSQGEKVLTILSKYGFHWAMTPKIKNWQPPLFPYCLRIIYSTKILRYGREYDYQKPPFYIADAEDFLRECALTEG